MLNKKAVSSFFAVLIAALMVISMFALQPSLVSTANAQSTQTTTVPSNLLQYEWPRFGYDGSGSRFSPGPAPSSPDILWSIPVNMPGTKGDSMAAFNGMLFVDNGTQTLALDPETSNVIWTNNATGVIQEIDESHMMIANNCYDTATGNLIWKGPPGFSAASGYRMDGYYAEAKMFFTGNTGWNLNDPSQPPTLAWNRTDIGGLGGIGAQFGGAPYGQGLLFGYGLGFAMAINATTGQTVWKQSYPFSEAYYGGGYYEGVYYQVDLAGNMFGLNATNGNLMWVFNPGTNWNYWCTYGATAYGNIYYYNLDCHLYAINALTGKEVWAYKAPGDFYAGNPIVADGMVYQCTGSQEYRDPTTGQNNGREYACVNATTGQLIWKLPITTTEQYFEHAIIAYGNLYVGVSSYPGMPSTGLTTTSYELWCINGQSKDWSMFGSDPNHSLTSSGPYTLNLQFKFQTEGDVISSCAIVNGVGYVGSLDHNIYAFNAETGSKIWNFTTGFLVFSSPAVVGGKVYTGADDGNIYCLDAATGTQIWKTPAGGIVDVPQTTRTRSSPCVVDGQVYVGSLDGNLYCLNANTGAVVWKFASGGDILSSPAVVDNAVYFTSNTPGANGTFYKLNTSDGSVIWSLGIPYGRYALGIEVSPTVADGMVFTADSAGAYYCINATTSAIIWKYTNPQTAEDIANNAGGMVAEVGGVLYANGRAFFADPKVFAFDCVNATNGNLLWQTWMGREQFTPPTYAVGRIYVGTENHALFILDAENGTKLSYYTMEANSIWSTPVLYQSKVYVGGFDGAVYCLGDAPQNVPAPAPSPTSGTTPQPSAAPSTTPATTPTTTPTTNPTPVTASPSAAASPAQKSSTEVYIVVAAAVIIIVVAVAAAVILRRRRIK